MTKKKSKKKQDLSRREFIKTAAGYAVTAATLTGCAHVEAIRTIAGSKEEYEYIVIGSGAGGGPVAANLAKAGHRVLLIEAGTVQKGQNTTVPAFHLHSTEDPSMAWNFFVKHYANQERQQRDSKYVPGKGILYPRAGTVGGCTAHNALVTLYPDNQDWDNIATLMNDRSWNSGEMRGYFERLERNHYIKPGDRNRTRNGFEGWLDTEQGDPRLLLKDPQLLTLVAEAAAKQGISRDVFEKIFLQGGNLKFDPNNWEYVQNKEDGIFSIPKVTKDGVRSGTRELILATIEENPRNLILKTGCLVTRLLFGEDSKRNRAVGVEYLEGEHLYRADPNSGERSAGMSTPRKVFATREIILAGGAFNSPQLLMLSGIGNEKHLKHHGIKPHIHLPGVGHNLQDRYEITSVTQLLNPFELIQKCMFGRPGDPCLDDYMMGHSSVYSTNGIVLALIKRSNPNKTTPDLVIFGGPSHFRGYYPGYSADGYQKNRFSWAVLKGHTNNTAGVVKLKSKDPLDTPDICFHYFDEGNDASGDDLEGILEGMKFARSLTQGEAVKILSDREVVPGREVATDDQMREFIRNESWGHHASCSNKMGPKEDPMAVVDTNFLVHGTQNLRIVDASVFPKIPGLFIVVPIYMVAEKASDVILAAARGNRI